MIISYNPSLVIATALLLLLFVAAILFVEPLAMAQQRATRTTAEEQAKQDQI